MAGRSHFHEGRPPVNLDGGQGHWLLGSCLPGLELGEGTFSINPPSFPVWLIGNTATSHVSCRGGPSLHSPRSCQPQSEDADLT